MTHVKDKVQIISITENRYKLVDFRCLVGNAEQEGGPVSQKRRRIAYSVRSDEHQTLELPSLVILSFTLVSD